MNIIIIVVAVLALVVVSVLILASRRGALRGKGPMESYNLNVPSFHGIDIGGAFEVVWTQSKDFRASLEIQANLYESVKASVSDGILRLGMKAGLVVSGSNMPVLRICSPVINSMNLSGAAHICGWSSLDQDNLVIDASGAAKIEILGRVGNLVVSSSGAGSMHLFELVAANVHVGISGAASIDVHATKNLDVSISGVGKVRYDGNPEEVKKNVSGVGTIRPR